MSNIKTRILYSDGFDGKGYTNENSLSNALLTKPDKISPVITHLAGREDNKFPLQFLTEGQKGGTRWEGINDIQYEYDTFNKLRRSDVVVSSTYGSSDFPGLGSTSFYVIMKTNWLKVQHNVVSPNGTRCRIMNRPEKVGAHYKYKMQLVNPDAAAYVNPDQFAAGAKWSMVGGATVPESLSFGNESNIHTPGKMKNQISILRKSYHLGGNITNKMVEVEFNIKGKGKTKYWIDFERWQHMLDWKQHCEEHYWYSEYNRRSDGEIPLRDEDTGLPIPEGAGVFAQIPNKDTYAFLTAKKIKNTVADVMYGGTDTGAMNIVLYTGEGGAEEFDTAMKDEASGFSVVGQGGAGDQFIGNGKNGGSGMPSRNLVFGGYFTQYQHVDGHMITLKRLPLLDQGGRAENSPKHPVTGKPLESYRMVFLDQSTYDGELNVKMVTQRGRGMITGLLKGMAPTPMEFGGNNLNPQLATEQDKSSIHFLSAKGVCIRRNTHCFELSCTLS